MNLAHIRLFAWLGTLVLLGGLGWTLWDYYQNLDTLSAHVSEEKQRQVLESVEAPSAEKDDLVDYNAVLAGFRTLDWSGKPPPPPPVETVTDAVEDEGPPKVPVKDLLRILHLRYDSGDPDGCLAFVKYIDPTLARANPTDAQLYIGDTLPDPYEFVVVESIVPEGVIFSFSDEERDHEILAPGIFGDSVSYIAKVGDDGILEATTTSYIGNELPAAPAWRPKETTAIGNGRLRLGVDDQEYFAKNWQEILSREVRTRRHRDPVTGRWDGIEIDSISPGSVAGRHGVESGDVLKSINGHPVTSKSEAITYVKNNDDRYDTWEVVIERLGREKTITYEEPPPQ